MAAGMGVIARTEKTNLSFGSKVRIVPDGAMLTFETFSAVLAAEGQDDGECLECQ
jgi:hypothetical protein